MNFNFVTLNTLALDKHYRAFSFHSTEYIIKLIFMLPLDCNQARLCTLSKNCEL